ncbi:unnamed protein product [Spirodela intermedia]|uniref:Protein kinase domain-containing protein n=1 Tax=Spirodela intermedia TaxID=51605 RepID=A0A7I8KKL7_SPIIN|nr:unnamed protein product [Spirodela intermedia]
MLRCRRVTQDSSSGGDSTSPSPTKGAVAATPAAIPTPAAAPAATPTPVPPRNPKISGSVPPNEGRTSVPSPALAPSSDPSSSRKRPPRKISKALIFGLVGAAVGSAVLVAVGIFCYRSNKVVTVKPWATGLSGQLQKAFVTGVTQLGRPELEAACEDFSNIIGTLSDSTLYKGTLSSGVEIAVASTVVNSAKDWSELYEAQFRKKISALSKVNHKNFSNLLGYCEEEEPFTRMMVFEYAPNGTLHELLHVREAEDLDWAKRLRVMMGIAYCLDYMHQLTSPVVLGNLTSSSIYLTDDFAAKVSDFEFWSETAAAAPPPASTSGPLGELARRPDVHPEEVVFKFGMLLLEIISGRPPVLTWASDYLKGVKPAIDLVDGNLKSFKEEEVAAICEVVVGCCNPMPAARPAMAEVVARLRTITGLAPEAATPKGSPLWWAELEIVSSDS